MPPPSSWLSEEVLFIWKWGLSGNSQPPTLSHWEGLSGAAQLGPPHAGEMPLSGRQRILEVQEPTPKGRFVPLASQLSFKMDYRTKRS